MVERSEKFSKPFGFGATGNMNTTINKPVPMKLFATWEVDRTSHNCIPRLCTLTLSHIVLLRSLGPDISSIVIAAKMQTSKRILRSNEIVLPSSNLLDTDLQLTFALQYPHFLKREENKLLILLQRRKKYKNRTILGFKTLAVGTIDMDQVLQRQLDTDLELFSDLKEKINPVGKVKLVGLNSHPVEQPNDQPDESSGKMARQSRLLMEDSDEEDETSSQEEGSDSEPMVDDGNPNIARRLRKSNRSKILAMPRNARQRNLKQKFIALLKRFKVNEDFQGLEPGHEGLTSKLSRGDMVDPDEIEDLFNELENLSDSGPEMDTLSVSSTPKPSLRPFFSSSKSLLQETMCGPEVSCNVDPESDSTIRLGATELSSHIDGSIDLNLPDLQAGHGTSLNGEDFYDVDKRNSSKFPRDRSSLSLKDKKCEQRRALEQLSRGMGDDNSIPESLILVSAVESCGEVLGDLLQEHHPLVIRCTNGVDVRSSLTIVVSKIQKFCNTNAKAPVPIKIVVIGPDSFLHSLLKPYVELLSTKPPDWHLYLRFLPIPLGGQQLSKYLGSVDSLYHSMFVDPSWREMCDSCDSVLEHGEEILSRVGRYIRDTNTNISLPVAEAMIMNYKDKGSDEESSQIFIPFLNEVRIGLPEVTGCSSIDLDESVTPQCTGGSPPSLGYIERSSQPNSLNYKENITPPSSPNMGTYLFPSSSGKEGSTLSAITEPLDLQVDYWLSPGKFSEKDIKKDKVESSRISIKACFKKLSVQRLPPLGDLTSTSLLLTYSIKDKRQKSKSSEIVQFGIQEAFTSVMRLGKKKDKDKEVEAKVHQVDNINRLICVSKHQHTPLKIFIDGVERNSVKFFQLSAQWPTQIKSFPVALFHYSESSL